MKRLFVILLLFSSAFAFGQNSLVENAVKNGFYIIRQNYILKEKSSGDFFTRKGKNELSYTYSLAFKTAGGYFITAPAVEPWKYDDVYNQLDNPENYTPVISYTLISELKKELGFYKIDTGRIFKVSDNLFLTRDSSASKVSLINCPKCGKDFYEVWVKKSVGTDFDKNTVNFSFETRSQKKSEQTFADYLGGVLVSVGYPEFGKIEIYLEGFFIKDGSNWKTVFVPEKLPDAVSDFKTKITLPKLELVPVENDIPTEENSQQSNINDKKKKKK